MAESQDGSNKIGDVELVEEINKDFPTVGYIYDDPAAKIHKSALERRLLLKLDIVVIGLSSMLFLVNAWDRNNIGNARVMGLEKDTHMSAAQYYNCISLYYVGYIIFVLPANLTIRFFRANRQLGGCVIVIAGLSCCMAAAKNAATILALRILFGVASPFLQSLSLYTSMWYKRNELATRVACFYSASTLAGAFSGLIAYGVQLNLNGSLGRPSWQWLFIIQGVAGIFIGVVSWIFLPPPPDHIKGKHWMFTNEELDLALTRSNTYNVTGAEFVPKQIWNALKDPKTLLFALANSGVSMGLASIAAFFPTFISEFGYSPVRTQLFSVIPYACAFVMSLLLNHCSDRFNSKGPVILFALSLSIIGYIILLAVDNVHVKIFGTCLVASGVYPCIILVGAWTNINIGGFTKRASTWAFVEIFGSCFSILGSHVYTDPPKYVKGHSVLLAFMSVSLLSTLGGILWMRHLNIQKDISQREYADRGELHPKLSMTLEEAGDNHPSFRYVL